MRIAAVNRSSSISYGIGGTPYAIKEAAYTMFVLLFYTQVLGLGGTEAGIVLFLGLLWDAVSDPMVGAWSDRFKSRWGRRHPFMVVGALPLGLGYLALFNPLEWALADGTLLAAWLLVCSLWIRTAITVIGVPHMALAAEMTQDYHERSHLIGMRSVSASSIVADLTDEHESTSGKRQEGGFYSVLSFTTKLASAAGPLYAGFALDAIGLTEGMMPGEVGQGALTALVWAMGIGIIPLMVIAWRFTLKVSMTEEQLKEIQENIKTRLQASP